MLHGLLGEFSAARQIAAEEIARLPRELNSLDLNEVAEKVSSKVSGIFGEGAGGTKGPKQTLQEVAKANAK